MELTEPIEEINRQLISHFGIDTEGFNPIFRVVWAADQYEKRLTNHTPDGFQLLYPEVRELPKYPQNDLYWKGFYILERLVIVPVVNEQELPGTAKSYEPLWVFRGANEKYVPPTFWGCKFVIDSVFAALGHGSMAKYVDEEAKNPIEKREERIDGLVNELFGDVSDLAFRTVTGEAVAYTGEPTIKPVKDGEE